MSKRSYKGALSHEAALEIMRADVGAPVRSRAVRALRGRSRGRARRRCGSASSSSRRPADRAGRARPQRHRPVRRPHRPAHAPAVRRHREQDSRRARSVRDGVADRRSTSTSSSTSTTRTATCRATRCCASSPVRCASSRQSTGIIGRYAGDEFVILLPHTPVDEAAELAERIRSTVRRASVPLRERSGSISVTLSMGVVGARAEHTDFDALFEAADKALYEAKRRGRDTVVSASEGEEAIARADDQPEAVRRPRRGDAAARAPARVDDGERAAPRVGRRRSRRRQVDARAPPRRAKFGCAPARSSPAAASRPTPSRRTRRGPK